MMNAREIRLGTKLREEMDKRNLSQVYLSRKVGMRNTTLHSYLYGVMPFGLENVLKLADFMSLSLDELVYDETKETEQPFITQLLGDYEVTISRKESEVTPC